MLYAELLCGRLLVGADKLVFLFAERLDLGRVELAVDLVALDEILAPIFARRLGERRGEDRAGELVHAVVDARILLAQQQILFLIKRIRQIQIITDAGHAAHGIQLVDGVQDLVVQRHRRLRVALLRSGKRIVDLSVQRIDVRAHVFQTDKINLLMDGALKRIQPDAVAAGTGQQAHRQHGGQQTDGS